MSATLKQLIAGNWKMNGLAAALAEIEAVVAGLASGGGESVDTLICPPATLIKDAAAAAAGSPLSIGAQDCHPESAGAHTGDVSAAMLNDAGASHIIVGHSERRQDHGETDALIKSKAAAVLAAGLTPIVCIGETRAERDAGETLARLAVQIAESTPDVAEPARVVLAYEPVWAIGTGLTPTIGDIAETHGAIKERLRDRYGDDAAGVRVLYGGSVKPGNAKDILQTEHVDGALVGGASLKASDFLAIVEGARGA